MHEKYDSWKTSVSAHLGSEAFGKLAWSRPMGPLRRGLAAPREQPRRSAFLSPLFSREAIDAQFVAAVVDSVLR